MESGKRVRELRKALALSGEKFGEQIGIKRNTLSQIETGKNNLTEQLLKSICREFNVNEDWLRTGEGEMFKTYDYDDEVAECIESMITEDYPFYNIIKGVMVAYNRSKPDDRKIIDKFMEQVVEILKKEEL